MSRRWILMVVGLVTSVSASGCGETRTYEDRGALCFSGSTSEAIGVDEEITLRVTVDSCTSACAEVRESECEVILDALDTEGVIVVSTRTRTFTRSGFCAAACSVLSTECVLPPLAAGEYRVRHGDEEVTLTVPSDDPPCESGF